MRRGIRCKNSIFRNSRSQIFFKIDVLKNFANFTGKQLCWGLSLITMAYNWIKKSPKHRCFPGKFAKFLRTLFLKKPLWWLLLILRESFENIEKIIRDQPTSGIAHLRLKSMFNKPQIKPNDKSALREFYQQN